MRQRDRVALFSFFFFSFFFFFKVTSAIDLDQKDTIFILARFYLFNELKTLHDERETSQSSFIFIHQMRTGEKDEKREEGIIKKKKKKAKRGKRRRTA
uniref:Secreted protein n=1 Tax=Anas zonorhyncha TaxID=75864 RepID=A0A8B9U0U4_9AVES